MENGFIKTKSQAAFLQLGFLRRVPQGSFSCRVAAIHLLAAGNFVTGRPVVK